MNISKMLGATMVAGALATGGAAAGIAGAAASPGSASSSETTANSGSGAPVASTSTTPGAPAPTQKSATPKTKAPGKHNCPNMGSHTAAGPRSGANAGSSYSGPPPGATYQ
ncbi:MAG: hypothetical protein JWO23_1661 [Solirubrobacterales bacterium]|nr:hypothetical protein [Solirubrobacterales bacterium]